MTRARLFVALTFLPGSKPYLLRRKVARWVEDCEKAMQAMVPGTPGFPRPIRRRKGDLMLTVDAVGNVLRAYSAMFAGKPEVAQDWLVSSAPSVRL